MLTPELLRGLEKLLHNLFDGLYHCSDYRHGRKPCLPALTYSASISSTRTLTGSPSVGVISIVALSSDSAW